jgi:hypothetical protein
MALRKHRRSPQAENAENAAKGGKNGCKNCLGSVIDLCLSDKQAASAGMRSCASGAAFRFDEIQAWHLD